MGGGYFLVLYCVLSCKDEITSLTALFKMVTVLNPLIPLSGRQFYSILNYYFFKIKYSQRPPGASKPGCISELLVEPLKKIDPSFPPISPEIGEICPGICAFYGAPKLYKKSCKEFFVSPLPPRINALNSRNRINTVFLQYNIIKRL